MKVRSPLLSLVLAVIASSNAFGQALWTGTIDSSLNNALNWTGGLPSANDLVFSTTLQPAATVNASLAVKSLTFNGLYPSYSFSSPNSSILSIGTAGMSVAAQGGNVVDFDSTLGIQLDSSQTWKIDGLVRVSGPISNATGQTTVLTKDGNGTLFLTGASTFNGGLWVQQGSVIIGTSSTANAGAVASGPVGTGQLTLAGNTTFGASKMGLTLANPVSLGSGVTLLSGSDVGSAPGLSLTGVITTSSNSVAVNLSGSSPLQFAGTFDGPANTSVRFQSVTTGDLDSAAFTGTTTANISSITADRAALYFSTLTSLPATLSVQAINNGYVGVASTSASTPIPASALLSRIADPANFAGTFGFDTQPCSGAPHVYSENLDFSNFKNAAFALGSTTAAVVSGSITPPINGSTAVYRFGGSDGVLFVQSKLGDAIDPTTKAAVPTSVVVTTTSGSESAGVVLSGANSYTGTTTNNGVTSNLRIEKAMAILDSATALPAAANFSLSEGAYIGITEATSYPSLASFLTHLAPGGSSANSVFGLDSHDFIQDSILFPDTVRSFSRRFVSGQVDLSSLANGFLGTVTGLQIDGEVKAPSSHVLSLTGVAGARLTITSPLTPVAIDSSTNITSVVVGYPSVSASQNFGKGEVELSGASTYTGGTTLQNGALIVGNTSTLSGGTLVSGPLGTGTLTVAPGATPVTLASNTASGATLFNAIALTGPLQLGLVTTEVGYVPANGVDQNLLVLAGPISGAAGLDIFGKVILSGANTYSGGTYAHRGGVIFANAAAIPALPLTSALRSDTAGYVGLASVPTSLQLNFIDRFDLTNTHGTIGFDTLDTTTTVFSDPISLIGFTSPTVRLGSATSAKLTGLITPADTTYRFGGGGGVLEVSSSLTGLGRSIDVSSSDGTSMVLRLTGINSYTGSTTANNSAVIFAAGSLPTTSAFAMDSTGYIGSEDPALDSDFTPFLTHFAANLDRGMIGFDASPAAGSRTIGTTVDLSRFTSTTPNFYIGTSSNLTFSSSAAFILPSNATAYRFAAYRGGRLQIDTVLTGAKGLIIGDPKSSFTDQDAAAHRSSVVLNAANTFSNGTTIYAGDVYLGTSSVLSGGTIQSGPLGVGSVTVSGSEFAGGPSPTLRALSGTVTLDNPITLNAGLSVAGNITLAGPISGFGGLVKVDSGTLTLSGNNSALQSPITVSGGGIVFSQDSSAGTGGLQMYGASTIATFSSSAPTIGSLLGFDPTSQVVLAPNSTLNIIHAGEADFLGSISGVGAAINLTGAANSVSNTLTLGGANTYTGGTTIGPNVTLIAAHNSALGTSGTVTLNQGSLLLTAGTVASFNSASHPLVLNSGKIGGLGTFASDASIDVKGNGAANGSITLDPGLKQPGQLAFNFTAGATLILDSGGTYHWSLKDATNPTGGWDSISVSGGVNIAATSIAPFNFTIETVGADGTNAEPSNFSVYSSYSWTLLTATSITGFDATKFNLDTTAFLTPGITGTFSLGLDSAGTSILLNYTAAAIPEPSTWALMITGVSLLAGSALRRRRR